MPTKILFVCAKNQWRSPTAAAIYRNDPRLEVQSAGLSQQSPCTLSAKLIAWAGLIMVMESSHAKRIRETYQQQIELPEIVTLDIPDDYPYMDPALVELLKESIEGALAEYL